METMRTSICARERFWNTMLHTQEAAGSGRRTTGGLMRDKTRRVLAGAARSLRLGGVAALALGAVAFVFALLTHGLDWKVGLDWACRLLYVTGALCLVVGGCGLLVSGRERADGAASPNEDDAPRAFWREVGLPWEVAICFAAVVLLAAGTVVEMLVLLVR